MSAEGGESGSSSSSESGEPISSGDEELPRWARAHVKKSWVDIGGLLEDDDVSAGALGGRDLPGKAGMSVKSNEWHERFWSALAAP